MHLGNTKIKELGFKLLLAKGGWLNVAMFGRDWLSGQHLLLMARQNPLVRKVKQKPDTWITADLNSRGYNNHKSHF